LAFEIPVQPYSGNIGETTIGAGSSAVKLGGEDAYSFHVFEGSMPNPPKIAMEVWDYDPSEEWAAAAIAPFKDVIASPEAWAKKCVEDYGADIIVLQLKSTDPNGMDRDANAAAEVAKKVADAIAVPLVVWGTANNAKDEEVLKKISEKCEGMNVGLGPVEEANHKGVGASALGYGHTIIASSPIDVNLAKQLNILLSNLGVKGSKIIVDPTTGGLGYGLEYSYSVMERIKMAALTQEDEKLQMPMISNIGNEVWKCKEAKESIGDAPTLGDPERRGILMESTAAVAYLLAGSDVVILRHPESVRLTRAFIDLLLNGGVASDVKEISKVLALEEADLIALSPAPDLNIAEAAAAPKAKTAAPEKKAPVPEKKAAAPAKTEAKVEPKKAEPKKEETKPEVDKEAAAKAKVEAEAKAKTDAEVKAKAEAEAKVKAEAAAKAKAEAAAKAKADAQAAAKAAEVAKRQAEEQSVREKRAKEQEARRTKKVVGDVEEVPKTAAKVQKTELEKMLEVLNRIHKRIL